MSGYRFDLADSKPKNPVLPLGTRAGCRGLAPILSSVTPHRSIAVLPCREAAGTAKGLEKLYIQSRAAAKLCVILSASLLPSLSINSRRKKAGDSLCDQRGGYSPKPLQAQGGTQTHQGQSPAFPHPFKPQSPSTVSFFSLSSHLAPLTPDPPKLQPLTCI